MRPCCQSEGQVLVDIMNDHGLEQLVYFPTREEITQDLILTSLPGQFQEVHSPDKEVHSPYKLIMTLLQEL